MTTRDIGQRKPQCALAAAVTALIVGFGASDAADAQNQQAALDEVTVTGSRIRQSGFNTPTPLTAVESDELALMAPGKLIEAVTQLPIFFNNTTLDNPGNFFTSAGSGSLNVRGLGTNRTLTLIDGRRMVSTNRLGSVDINMFPDALIERIEVVTGGASAAYGTDAVAGVTNFILNKNFEGLKTHFQAGDSSEGSRGLWEGSVAYGREVGERGHMLFSFDTNHQDGVFSFDGFDWFRSYGTISSGISGGPRDVIRPDVVSSQTTLNGVINAPGSAINRLEFLPDGTVRPFVLGSPAVVNAGTRSQSITNGGSGTLNANLRPTLSPQADLDSAFFYFDYDLSDSLKIYTQLLRGRTQNRNTNLGGVFQNTTQMTIFQDNAFLPDSVRQTMINEGRASFTFDRVGGPDDLAAGAFQETENSTGAITLGFSKDLSRDGMLDGWQVRGYVQRGENEHRGRHIGGIRLDRIIAAIDAVDDGTGNIVCRPALIDPANFGDCVPLNLFGAGQASPEAIDYVTGFDPGEFVSTPVFFSDGGFRGRSLDFVTGEDKLTLVVVEQNVFDVAMDGELGRTWAGPISAAFGVHWREEEMLQLTFDPTNPTGEFSVRPNVFPGVVRGVPGGIADRAQSIQFATVPNIIGRLDVREAFGEAIIPLVTDRAAADRLTGTLAWRWADYSRSGSIRAWKLGLDWQVNDLLRVRATDSRDVRAATLSERFDRTGGTTSFTDPVFNNAQLDASLATGGNPGVAPEEADTVTAGFVLQPPALEGFQASIDWYEIDITGAIGQLGVQRVVDDCFAGALELCALINRDPITNRIVFVQNLFLNIDASKVSGVDTEVAYRTSLGPGSLSWRFLATRLNENSITNVGAAKVDRAGEVGNFDFPEWKLTTNLTYTQGPFTAFLQARYIDSGTLDQTETSGIQIDNNNIPSVTYTDLNFSYSRDRVDGGAWEVFSNVTNLFDRDPPVAANFSTFTASSIQNNQSLYDVLGRRYTLGFRYEF